MRDGMWYGDPDITPAEFEQWVASVFHQAGTSLDDFRVEVGERIRGTDGSFKFDATARFTWNGLGFLVLVEAKLHRNPIKRELVEVLHSKMLSVGAQKGVLVSTSRFQDGALEFAKAHGIALIKVTEGRFTIEMKSIDKRPPPTREHASVFGVETFVGHRYEAGDGGAVGVTHISAKHPEYLREFLLET